MKSFATHDVDLGPCDCPGTPHDHDHATIKDRFTYGDVRRILSAIATPGVEGLGLGQQIMFWRAIVTWTKTGDDGQPLAVSLDAIDDLTPEQAQSLVAAVDNDDYARQLGIPILPNRNGGSSPDGPVDSPISATSTPASSTTTDSETISPI